MTGFTRNSFSCLTFDQPAYIFCVKFMKTGSLSLLLALLQAECNLFLVGIKMHCFLMRMIGL
jgi:hypothetical protein